MNNNKYYTPTIEEFHVGFEYEFRTLKGWYKKVMTWNDYPNYAGDYIGEAIRETDGLRVKHLDREDIESLGFKFEGGKLTEEVRDFFVKDDITLTYNYKTKTIWIEDKVEYIVNKGIIINNLSELKVLLRQLSL